MIQLARWSSSWSHDSPVRFQSRSWRCVVRHVVKGVVRHVVRHVVRQWT